MNNITNITTIYYYYYDYYGTFHRKIRFNPILWKQLLFYKTAKNAKPIPFNKTKGPKLPILATLLHSCWELGTFRSPLQSPPVSSIPSPFFLLGQEYLYHSKCDQILNSYMPRNQEFFIGLHFHAKFQHVIVGGSPSS